MSRLIMSKPLVSDTRVRVRFQRPDAGPSRHTTTVSALNEEDGEEEMLGDVRAGYRHRRTPDARASVGLRKQRGNRAEHHCRRDEKPEGGWRWRRVVLLGGGAAAIGVRLGDGPVSVVLGSRSVHRTRSVGRAAGQACFRGRHPAGAEPGLTCGKREGQESRYDPLTQPQHLCRMRHRVSGVNIDSMRGDDRDRDFWERKAPQYDSVATGVFGRPLPRALELTASGVSGAETVLEVAAGTGLMTAVIAPRVRQVVATDYADNMLALLRERMKSAGIANVVAEKRDIYALGYPPGSFDIVVAGNVLHLVPDFERAIDALCQPLRPGGKLITPTFVHDETALAWVASRVLAHVLGQPMHRRFTAESLRRGLERRGLTIARAETIPGLIPIAYVESVLERRG